MIYIQRRFQQSDSLFEGFFSWLVEKTDIQKASKVRSENWLILHVFGKIAAALVSWIF
ncbi:MAG: hypothetical protein ACI9XO_003013 [Paraglaciecola sp.]|jgi:hypothetical protein